jgi:hypothetical protein
MMIRILARFAFLVAISSSSFAQAPAVDSLPAVSQINGKISLEAGATGAQGQSSAVGIAQGSLTAPLGHSFGAQIDGLASTSYGSFGGGGAAHLPMAATRTQAPPPSWRAAASTMAASPSIPSLTLH